MGGGGGRRGVQGCGSGLAISIPVALLPHALSLPALTIHVPVQPSPFIQPTATSLVVVIAFCTTLSALKQYGAVNNVHGWSGFW